MEGKSDDDFLKDVEEFDYDDDEYEILLSMIENYDEWIVEHMTCSTCNGYFYHFEHHNINEPSLEVSFESLQSKLYSLIEAEHSAEHSAPIEEKVQLVPHDTYDQRGKNIDTYKGYYNALNRNAGTIINKSGNILTISFLTKSGKEKTFTIHKKFVITV